MWLLLWKVGGQMCKDGKCCPDKRPLRAKWSVFLITNLKDVILFQVPQHGEVQFPPNKMYYCPINGSHLSETVLQFIKA